jgi:hypothetical protein
MATFIAHTTFAAWSEDAALRPRLVMAPLPRAPFVAHLIAAHLGVPQARTRRRAERAYGDQDAASARLISSV